MRGIVRKRNSGSFVDMLLPAMIRLRTATIKQEAKNAEAMLEFWKKLERREDR